MKDVHNGARSRSEYRTQTGAHTIDYLGQYKSSERVKAELRRFGKKEGVVIDGRNYAALRERFGLVPERDNKSEWSASALATTMGRYADTIPSALFERVAAMERKNTEQSLRAEQNSDSEGTQPRGSDPSTDGALDTSNGDGPEYAMAVRTERSRRRDSVASGQGSSSRGKFTEHWSSSVYERAISASLHTAGGGARRNTPLEAATVLERYVDPQSYAGAPYFCRNEDVDTDRIIGECASILGGTSSLSPFLALHRVQHGRTSPKSRLVWAAPLATTILSTAYSKPCYESLVGRRAFAFGASFRSIGSRLVDMHSRRRYIYALDFSGFDASLAPRLIDDAFGILRTHLNLDQKRAVFWKRMINDFIHTRIVLPDGSMWQVHRGVPSGSAFTSLVDSVCNIIILNYVWIRLTGRPLRAKDVCVLGDDSVVAHDWYLEIGAIESAAAELGIIVSAEKSERVALGGSVPFLGHNWKAGRPHREPFEIARRLAFPERFSKWLKDERYSLYRRYSMTTDCIEALEIFVETVPWYGQDLEAIVMDACYGVDMHSLFRVLSRREVVNAWPGRLEFRERVEQDTDLPSAVLSPRAMHIGRTA